MSTISNDDVKKLAALSGLKVSEGEVEKYQRELSAIVDYVQQLDAVDVTGLEPTYQVNGLKNVMRNDEVIDYNVSTDALLSNAPRRRDTSVEVPRVLG